MSQSSTSRFRAECDGCGSQVPSPVPTGWFARPLDPPYYSGPRQILFCPDCYRELPARLRRPWLRLEPEGAPSWLASFRRRLRYGLPARRGTVG
jgi:hypothetical protein